MLIYANPLRMILKPTKVSINVQRLENEDGHQ